MEAVWVAFFALIGIACTVAGPIILAKMMAKQQAEKEERDYARQDEVAKRVTEAAENLVVQNERVALATEITNTKLDEVHTIVNQQRTDMVARIDELKNALVVAGLPIPPDATRNPGGSP